MNLTAGHFDEIEAMGKLFISPEDIAVNLGLSEEETELFIAAIQIRDPSNSIFQAYFKGRLESEIKLRTAINQAALNGSSPAQQLMTQFRNETNR
jgi:hypothetical protein